METINLNCFVFDQTERKAYSANKNKIHCYSLPEPIVLSTSTTDCSISSLSVLSSTSIIIFSGSIGNSFFPPTKAVFYDTVSQQNIFITSFENPIIAITSINKYAFFEVKGNELNVFKYENEKSIVFINKLSLPTSEEFSPTCLIWSKTTNDIISYYVAYATEDNEIGLIQYFDYLFIPYTKSNKTISSSIKSFQNFFYDAKLDSLFFVESQGKRIEEVIDYDTFNYSIIRKYFRGTRTGYITDIRRLEKHYVAMANYDKTILIFFYGEQDVSVASLIMGIINQGIVSCIKINLKEMNSIDSCEQEDLPQRKSEMRLLVNNVKGNELCCYTSSGFYYSIKIDYMRKMYSLINKSIFWCINNK